MELNRRRFFLGLGVGLIAAPAIIKIAPLMNIKPFRIIRVAPMYDSESFKNDIARLYGDNAKIEWKLPESIRYDHNFRQRAYDLKSGKWLWV